MNKTARNICIGLLALIIIVGILCWIFAAGGGRKAKPEPAGGQTEQTDSAGKTDQTSPETSGQTGSQPSGGESAGQQSGNETGGAEQTGNEPGGAEQTGNESGGMNGTGEEAAFVSSRPETQMLSAPVEGETEGFMGSLFCGMLEDGGSKLPYSVYYDAELLSPAQQSGRFENDYGAFMEFRFHAGLSKNDVSPSAANDYIDFTSIEFLENEAFAGREANIVNAMNSSEICTVYVFDCEGGCVSAATVSSLEAAEGMLHRMQAMAETFEAEK